MPTTRLKTEIIKIKKTAVNGDIFGFALGNNSWHKARTSLLLNLKFLFEIVNINLKFFM